jgi:predicted TIM-barrel fold metal-dependent hydrolase
MKPLIIVSADGHVGARVKEYREYLDPKYHHLIPELQDDEDKFRGMQKIFNLNNPERMAVIDERNTLQTEGVEKSSWDVTRRLQELDAEGIAAEIVYPGTTEQMMPFFYSFNRPYPDDVRMAGGKAYHRWLADTMLAPGKGRILGAADPGPSTDMRETLAELNFVADRGFRTVFVPGHVLNPALPPLFDRHFEPFWAACNELGLVLTIHAGWNTKQGEVTKLVDEATQLQLRTAETGDQVGLIEGLTKIAEMMSEENTDSIFSMDLAPRQAIWQMIFGGVFDRYPKLKLVIVECRANWVPALKADLDRSFAAAPHRPNIKMKPSEYFGQNVFIAPSAPRRGEVQQRYEIGLDTFLFASDFPHPEGTWPNTLTWMRAVFGGLPEGELRSILGENAIGVYGLDKDMLAGIAAKIGFAPGDIIGDRTIDPRVIEDFNVRSFFSSETKPFDQREVDRRIVGDLSNIAAGAA